MSMPIDEVNEVVKAKADGCTCSPTIETSGVAVFEKHDAECELGPKEEA